MFSLPQQTLAYLPICGVAARNRGHHEAETGAGGGCQAVCEQSLVEHADTLRAQGRATVQRRQLQLELRTRREFLVLPVLPRHLQRLPRAVDQAAAHLQEEVLRLPVRASGRTGLKQLSAVPERGDQPLELLARERRGAGAEDLRGGADRGAAAQRPLTVILVY